MSNDDKRPWPQAGRERMIFPTPIDICAFGVKDPHDELLAKMDQGSVFMMGDNPALPRMPDKPTLIDFFNLRFTGMTNHHLTTAAKRAFDEGANEKVIMACLLHDIANGCLLRTDHGYWGAQLIAPYVDEEVAWAVKYHQSLRYTPDPNVGYPYPEAYLKFFGEDYDPPAYIKRDAAYAMQHKWYMTARYVTMYDLYFFDEVEPVKIEFFADIIARNFRQPEEGLGHDDSPSSHMWRTMIWPNNFL